MLSKKEPWEHSLQLVGTCKRKINLSLSFVGIFEIEGKLPQGDDAYVIVWSVFEGGSNEFYFVYAGLWRDICIEHYVY